MPARIPPAIRASRPARCARRAAPLARGTSAAAARIAREAPPAASASRPRSRPFAKTCGRAPDPAASWLILHPPPRRERLSAPGRRASAGGAALLVLFVPLLLPAFARGGAVLAGERGL